MAGGPHPGRLHRRPDAGHTGADGSVVPRLRQLGRLRLDLYTPLQPHRYAWRKAGIWARRRDEFVKRAGFALLAALAVHDKRAPDRKFIDGLALVEGAADDGRNFVKKAVNWALRQIGKRNQSLNVTAVAVSRRLAASPEASARWIGTDALRELTSAAVARRLAGCAHG